jgi:heterodisulfide reductase subunit B2
MKYTYYPGCSLEGTARDYAASIQGVCDELGIELDEIPDWICCGATSAHSIDNQASIALAARTLNQAAEMSGSKMLVPCPMCFNRLKTASHVLGSDERDRYPVILSDSVPEVWDLANLFATEEMLDLIKGKVKKPLEGLNVVCYYGCMANRPPEITGAEDHENPQALDRIVTSLGGIALSWPYKTDCCGASQLLSLEEVETRLVEKLFDMAHRVGARGVVVSCQMCQANLDMYYDRTGYASGKTPAMPIYYFTELIGIALEIKNVTKWLSKHLTDPFPLLGELGLIE